MGMALSAEADDCNLAVEEVEVSVAVDRCHAGFLS
jgi:hypothetical protein